MYWRNYCSSIGNTTQIGEVWTMIKNFGLSVQRPLEWGADYQSLKYICKFNKVKDRLWDCGIWFSSQICIYKT